MGYGGSADVTAPVRVLVLCIANSSRSILAEALFRELGGGRISVESAGSEPAGFVHPLAAAVLDEAGIDHGWARSKPMSDFLDQPFDHVITVCDEAAETCPVFPGPARRTHWSIADPAAATGGDDERLRVYRATYADLRERVAAFLATLEA
jgi:arsenate reductase